jgi:hypothetical protein
MLEINMREKGEGGCGTSVFYIEDKILVLHFELAHTQHNRLPMSMPLGCLHLCFHFSVRGTTVTIHLTS